MFIIFSVEMKELNTQCLVEQKYLWLFIPDPVIFKPSSPLPYPHLDSVAIHAHLSSVLLGLPCLCYRVVLLASIRFGFRVFCCILKSMGAQISYVKCYSICILLLHIHILEIMSRLLIITDRLFMLCNKSYAMFYREWLSEKQLSHI